MLGLEARGQVFRDRFLIADVFLLAVHRGYGSPIFDAAIARTAGMLKRKSRFSVASHTMSPR